VSIVTLIVIILAICGIVWAYPRLPSPWNIVLVAIVVIISVMVLLNYAGVPLHLS
jgi:membrane protein implicated in regulation of membrane protease activity